ncbi:MAG: AAA domain-containing protein [Acidimicrobiales bacterium]
MSFDLLDRAAIHSTLDQLARVRSTLGAHGADVAERLANAAACSSVLQIIDLWRQGRLLPDSVLATVAAPPWSIECDRALDRLDTVVAAQAAALQVLSASAFSPDIDLGPLLVAGQEAADAGLLSRGRKERAFVGLVAPLLVAEPPDAASLLNLLRHVAAARPQLTEAYRVVADLPGASLAGAWSPLDTGDRTRVRQVLTELPGQARAMASPASATARSALAAGWVPDETFVEALRYAGDAWSWLLSALGADEASIARWRNGDTFWKAWSRSESGWTTDGSRLLVLQRWTEIATAVEPLRDGGLGVLADGVLCGDLRASELFDRFRRGFIDVALEERLEAGRIDLFDGRAHDRRIEDFAARDKRRRLLTRDQIPADLVASRPMHRGKRIGRWGALEQELQRKSRKLSIRGLVEQYSDILPSLTPCFMMSPDSVSRFIPPGSIMFDLVVFDEASQIEVARAMGAVGRAKALVVVGDTKQMPPTRFGGSGGPEAEAEADPEDENLYIDMESILSECVESNMPKRDLRCHYRSRHEALIAFSNQNFYDGRLTTFPSPLGSDHSPIGWRRVDGVFLRSGKGDSLRTNPVEAEAMVAEIILRVSDPETSKQSIAVVTLNIQQQQLILNLLEGSSDDKVKALVEDDGENGLIVRNLESVQGDERDVVMISVAFSPLITTDDAGVSQRGRMPLNFGPLNRLGGERRLNVAVTRAREEVVVFCSFEPEEMQLSETSSLGVQLLRTYLLAARDGGRQSGDLVLRSPTAPDAHRSEVADALRARGLRVQENLGLSDFRIDLALSRPGDDGWKVAVLLDGPGWAAKKTVYDREVLPRSVLCGAMGWAKIERIWFPMWLNARDEVIDIIVAAVDATSPPPTASAGGDHVEGAETSEDVVIAAPQQEAACPPGLPFQSSETVQEMMPADTSMRSDSKEAAGPSLVATQPVESERPAVGAVPHPSSETLGEPLPYEVLGTRDVLDRITERGPRQLVLQAIQEVIRRDAPVPPAFVAYTVALQFGLERVRQNRLDAIIDVIPANLRIEGHFGEFVWRPDQDPASYDEYRTEMSDGAPPGVDIVPPEELVNAMFEIVTNGVAVSVEELATHTAAEFGLKRVPAAARNYLNEVIAWAVEVGWLAAVDGAIRVPTS